MAGFGLGYRELLPHGVDMEFERIYSFLRNFLLTEHNEDGTHRTAPIAQAVSQEIGLPVGTMVDWPTVNPPVGWMICDGSAINRQTFNDLFLVIGTTFGAGDGATTFNLPDFRGRFALGKAASGTGSTIGTTGGQIDHVHTGPSHTHDVNGAPTSTTNVSAGGTPVASATHGHGQTAAAGAGTTGSANPPFLVINKIILYS